MTNNIDWKRKLTSRKFWAAVCNFVGMLVVALGGNAGTAETITALIMAGATVIAYIIAEGLVDAAGSSGGGALMVEATESEGAMVLSKTWKEISDAVKTMPVVIFYDDLENSEVSLFNVYSVAIGDVYIIKAYQAAESGDEVVFELFIFTTDSETGYPTFTFGG